ELGAARRLLRAAEALTAGGAALALLAGRVRDRRPAAVAGAALLAGSAALRFGVFRAGVASAEDPKYTVVPQRERLGR
ncbi:polysulfide reductase, partial [Streptomyces sp. SID2999]|nr:polysulfide reductase [Streptomyces sp. SID2999]